MTLMSAMILAKGTCFGGIASWALGVPSASLLLNEALTSSMCLSAGEGLMRTCMAQCIQHECYTAIVCTGLSPRSGLNHPS